MGGRRLRPARGALRQAAVAHHPCRRRCRLVQHRADQLVAELVPATGLHQQTGPAGVLGAAGHLFGREVGDLGHLVEVEGGARNRRHPQHLVHLGTATPHAGGDRRLQRCRQGHPLGPALGQRPQRFDHEQRMTTGYGEHLGGPVPQPHRGRHLFHRGLRQWAQLDQSGQRAELRDRLVAFLGSQRGHNQQRCGPLPPQQEVQQLQR